METAIILTTNPEAAIPAPCDLDDLIFQGECWFASDR